ncbi:MAG: hypothetical protein ACKVOU_09945 [Cytophagales bacterium]
MLFFCVFVSTYRIAAQEKNVPKIRKKTSLFDDSTQTYRKLEKFAKKRKLTNEIFRNVFSLPSSKKYTGTVKKQNEDIYAGAENKIIRNIIIVTLDPFGTDIADTTQKPLSYLEKGGNLIHVKTKRFAIKNRLLIKEGDVIDKIMLHESERIIRSSEFIADASIRLDPDYRSKDSVDIMVRTQDRWSIYPSGNIGSNYKFNLSDRNIIGSGQQLDASVFKAQIFDTTAVNYRFSYFAPYIKQSFITAGIIFNAERGNEYVGTSVNRIFYSPLTRWAGGVDLFNYSTIAILTSTIDSSKTKFYNLRYWTADAWAGLSFPIRGASYQNRTTKFVMAGRFFNKNYQNAPMVEFDPIYNQQNQTNFMINFGLTQRGYYKDKFIYKYGVTEDVPIGSMVAATLGYQISPFAERYYVGVKSSYGVKFRGGNASAYFELGSFINAKGSYEQGSLNTGIQGFTSLVEFPNRILYRQFISLDFTVGLNRSQYDRITINDVKGLSGFNPVGVIGSNKMVLSTTAIFYLPWQVLGFRIAPIFNGGFGMIGDEDVSFLKDNVFPVFGFGLQIRNEYLILSSFLITIGYYPYIPSVGNSVIKLNPFGSNDFRFRNFEIGKPSYVGYY